MPRRRSQTESLTRADATDATDGADRTDRTDRTDRADATDGALRSHAAGPGTEGPADADHDDDDGPSKSQRKRDSHALQALGEQLVSLSPDRLKRMDIPGALLDAIALAQRITSREGRRRQLQYVGKLMRGVDAEAIRSQLDLDGRQHRIDTAIQHAAERWRETLVESPERLGEYCERYPRASRDALDTVLQAAKAELARGERGRRYRDLFRQLRDSMVKNDDE
jgi:ribosome-associated protein